MANQDVINNHPTPAEKALVASLVGQLEVVLQPYLRNLTDEENVKYGSISEKNKLFVNKDNDLHLSNPALQSPDVNWIEFDADFQSRYLYENLGMRLEFLLKAIGETRRLHDYDNYQCALLDYAYAQYKDRTSPGLGYDSKVKELGQFFEGGGPSEPTPENP